jgi:hypothetical protein
MLIPPPGPALTPAAAGADIKSEWKLDGVNLLPRYETGRMLECDLHCRRRCVYHDSNGAQPNSKSLPFHYLYVVVG